MKRTIEVANVILVNGDKNVLFLQRAAHLVGPGLWCLPGGMIDDREIPEIAATRELEEETAITRKQIALLAAKEFIVSTPQEDVRIYSYLASLAVDAAVTVNSDECVDYAWMTQERIFESDDLLPCAPTMVASTLVPGLTIHDRTITDGISIQILK